MSTQWSPDVCIYHGGCDDGFGAAWAIWRRWPKCEFVPGYYGQAQPDMFLEATKAEKPIQQPLFGGDAA